MVKIWPFLTKIAIFECFCLYFPNAAINFHNFWYVNYTCGFLWENHCVYAGKILRWPKFGHLWPKLTVLRVFYVKLPNADMNNPNFWYGSCSYGLLSENHTLHAGKILIWRNLVHLRPFLAKIDSFESSWPITSKRGYESS